MENVIIIPSLNPGQELVSLTDELVKMGANKIVIVNDGSDDNHSHIFRQLISRESISIIEHTVNLGKGAALKTALLYCSEHFNDITGVITADADGQHTAKDIFRISEAMTRNPDHLILGVRVFEKSSTPFRSYIGNKITSLVFGTLYHVKLIDTQTGLRGIPASELEWMIKTSGQRYDYELNMLIQATRKGLKMVQLPVEILYFNDNKGSHFKTLSDSMRIIKTLISNLFSDKNKSKPHYGRLFYFSRWLIRIFNRSLTVIGEPPAGPTVFVGHHQNLKGVLRIMMWLNTPVRLWVLKDFFSKNECFEQYASYTFTQRMGWNKMFSSIASYLPSRFVPRLMKSMRAIPVYRKSIKSIKLTINESVDALCKNENLLIFPDIDYTSNSDALGEMYMGFIYIDKYYHQKTGRHVSFVPIRSSLSDKQISFGTPSRISDDEIYSQAKNRIIEELRREFNSMPARLDVNCKRGMTTEKETSETY